MDHCISEIERTYHDEVIKNFIAKTNPKIEHRANNLPLDVKSRLGDDRLLSRTTSASTQSTTPLSTSSSFYSTTSILNCSSDDEDSLSLKAQSGKRKSKKKGKKDKKEQNKPMAKEKQPITNLRKSISAPWDFMEYSDVEEIARRRQRRMLRSSIQARIESIDKHLSKFQTKSR